MDDDLREAVIRLRDLKLAVQIDAQHPEPRTFAVSQRLAAEADDFIARLGERYDLETWDDR